MLYTCSGYTPLLYGAATGGLKSMTLSIEQKPTTLLLATAPRGRVVVVELESHSTDRLHDHVGQYLSTHLPFYYMHTARYTDPLLAVWLSSL